MRKMRPGYYELGFEVRMRIAAATACGVFFGMGIAIDALGEKFVALGLLLIGLGFMWLATNNRLFVRKKENVE